MPFVRAEEMVVGRPVPGWTGRFFHSGNMTFAFWDVAAGAGPVPEHEHPNEEVWNILEGEFAVRIAGEERTVGPGMAAVVPAETLHAVRPLGSGRALVVDFPLREELPGVRGD